MKTGTHAARNVQVYNLAFRLFVLISLLLPSLLSFPSSTVFAEGSTSLPAGLNMNFIPSNIPAGDVSLLTIIIYNPNYFPLTLSSVPAALTDTLPTGVNFASPADAATTCGGGVALSGQTLSLIGGTVPAKVGDTNGSCQITVKVTSVVPGNHDNYIYANTLKATDPTGTISITNPEAKITLGVSAIQPPSLNKQFVPNTQWVGLTSNLRITIHNNDLNNPLTEVTLTDNLPTNVTVGNTTVTFTGCGAGAQVTGPGGAALAAGQTSFILKNATILPNTDCVARVNVISTTPNVYQNNIPANAIQSRQAVSNSTAASAPINYQAIGMTKSFAPANFQAGGSSTATIRLENPSAADYTGVTFTDTLPTGLTVSGTPNPSQCGGSVEFTSNSVKLTGGTVPKASGTNGVCLVTFDVTSSISGSYTNTIYARTLKTDQNATNVVDVTANVSVYAAGTGVSGVKTFSPSTIPVGGVSRLRIDLTAPADVALTNFSITDALPTGVFVAPTPNATKGAGCVGGTFAPAAGGTTVVYTGGRIEKGLTCRLEVNVTSSVKGAHINTISPLNISNAEGRRPGGNISGTLTVSGITVAKSFYPSNIAINGITTVTVVLTNNNTSQINNVVFTDSLPSGLVIADDPKILTTCGATDIVNATPTATSYSVNGGTIPAQVGSVPGICTVNVNVKGTTTGVKTNYIPANDVTGVLSNGNVPLTNPAQARADMEVMALTIRVNKEFLPLTVFGGAASTMTITLTNPNNALLSGIEFEDFLPESTDPLNPGNMTVAVPAQISYGDCGGSITIAPDRRSFKYTGGSLAANANCKLKINMTMDVSGNLINTIGVGDVKTTNGATNPQPASATLTNLPGVSITKVFETNPVPAGSGNASRLIYTLRNTGNVNLTQLGFVDDGFPIGLTVAFAPEINQCGGIVNSTAGSVTLTNGALAASASCVIYVDVVSASSGSFQNCIPAGAITSYQNATNADPTCDTLVVEQSLLPPAISKAFSPNPVRKGATAGLTFTITNPNSVALTGVAFTDTFPTGLTRASVPNATQCGGTVSSTSGSVSLTGGTIAAKGSCTVTMAVSAAAGGEYPNTTSTVTSTNGGTGGTASATLVAVAPPVIGKAFAPNPVNAGEVSTLTFTITNPAENTVALSGVAFSDTFPIGMYRSAVPATPQCGGTVISTNNSIALSGGSIPVNSSCTVTVSVTAANAGMYANTSSTVTATNGGTGNQASDNLAVDGVGMSLEKTSDRNNYKVLNEVVTYSYKLTNTGSGEAALYGPFTVTDDRVGNFTCGSAAQLLPGESLTCTAPYTITESDMAAKSVTNLATASAKDAGDKTVTSNESTVTVRLAALNLIKSASPLTYRLANTNITYTYTLTNTGNITLYAPFMVTDNKLAVPFSCGSAGSLQTGGVTTCTATYRTTAGDVTAGSVVNLATATAKDAASGGANVASNQASQTVIKVVPPAISKAFSPNPIALGGSSTLTFTITNTNPVGLTGIGLVDVLPAGMTPVVVPSASQCGGSVAYDGTANSITLTNGSIIPNASCNVTVLVTTAAQGNYLNTSNAVTSTNAGNGNTAQATLKVITSPTISKSFSPASITEGENSTLTIRITNPAGNTLDLEGVAFSDTFPAGMTIAAGADATLTDCGSPIFAPNVGDGVLNFSGGSIAVNKTCVITVPVTTTDAGVFDNTTDAVSATNGGSGLPSNTARLTVGAAADLAVTKDDGVLAVSRDDELTYQVVVTNNGPSDASGARLVDNIPSSLVDAAWTCTADDGASCSASGEGSINDTISIPAGKSVRYSITATVASDAATTVLNNAAVVPPLDLTDPNLDNNTENDSDGLNLLEIEKSSETSEFTERGQEIIYTYVVKNTGTSTLAAPFSVKDDKTEVTCEPAESLEPASQITCTGSYIIKLEDLDAGGVTNKASAEARDLDGDKVTSNQDELTIPALQQPGIGLAKRLTGIAKTGPGSYNLTFEFVVENFGNVSLQNVQVTDDLNAAFSVPEPASFSVVSISSDDFTVNDGFNGSSDTKLLAEENSLAGYTKGKVTLVVNLIPSFNYYENSAVVSASHPSEEIVSDISQNGSDPDPDGDDDPLTNNDPTPVQFDANLFDPPSGVKTVDASGRPLLKWTMVWMNNANIVGVNAEVSDPLPPNTEYYRTAFESGFDVPLDAPKDSTNLGVTCTAAGESVTTACYYEAPTPEYLRGRVIWRGNIGPDLGVKKPAKALNAVTITFYVRTINNAQRVRNKATISSDLNGNGTIEESETAVAVSNKTWSADNDGELPQTGFAPGVVTQLPAQPANLAFTGLNDMRLRIPALAVELPIVGVPQTDANEWDLTWLGQQAGWLQGTAFPTWSGNSAITAHVYDANGMPGPFADLHKLKWGDQVIVEAFGQKYVYEVRGVDEWVSPEDSGAITSEAYPWLTLITCKGYNTQENAYDWRVVVRAVQVSVD